MLNKRTPKGITLLFSMFCVFFLTGCFPYPSNVPIDNTVGNTPPKEERGTETSYSPSQIQAETYHHEEEYVVEQKQPVENNGLFGTWYIYIPSSITNLYDKQTGEYVTHEFTPGADAGQIELNENGTYVMYYPLWDDRPVRGKWYISDEGEINGEASRAIILMNGVNGVDWAISPSTDGTLRLLQYSGVWADGSSMWIIDSELYR